MGDPEFDSDRRHALQPFSLGPRNCLGGKYVLLLFKFALKCDLLTILTSLAYAEMRLIPARMIWNFDMELVPESQDWVDQLSFVV